jgi:hypothetical protein
MCDRTFGRGEASVLAGLVEEGTLAALLATAGLSPTDGCGGSAVADLARGSDVGSPADDPQAQICSAMRMSASPVALDAQVALHGRCT